jgi:hypothetical protein
MENNVISKIVLDTKLDGKRNVQRPKLKWVDGVQADLNMLELKNGEEKPKIDQNEIICLGRLRLNCKDCNAIEEEENSGCIPKQHSLIDPLNGGCFL